MEEVAKKNGWPTSQVALAWVSYRASSPIVGFSSAERIYEARGCGEATLTVEEEAHLEGPYVSKNIGGHD